MNPPLSSEQVKAFYQQRKVLVVGGLGFIGSTLAHLLVAQGAKVTLLDNFLPDHGANWHNLEGIREQVNVQVSDLRNSESLRQLLQEQQLVFNIGGQTSHSDSMLNPFLDLDINCRGNLILLEACRELRPEMRIVFAGTRAFYGTPESLPVDESARLLPQDVYAVNRLAAEQYHLVYHRHYGLPVTSLRLGNLYGPRGQMQHPRYNVLNYFVRMALENQTIRIYGDGSQRRDYLYVADAAEALLRAGASEHATGKVYNVGSGQDQAFVELVRTIVRLAGQGAYEHVEWPAGSKAYDVGDFVMEIGAIQQDLDWQPSTSLEQGLKQTLDYYDQRRSQYWG